MLCVWPKSMASMLSNLDHVTKLDVCAHGPPPTSTPELRCPCTCTADLFGLRPATPSYHVIITASKCAVVCALLWACQVTNLHDKAYMHVLAACTTSAHVYMALTTSSADCNMIKR